MKLPCQFDRYELIELIASGGMAQVYRARSQGPGGFEKTVAVKIIQPHYSSDQEFINMLIDEAKITAKLDHPNIVKVIDLFAHENRHAIVMEYIEGKDLRQIITMGQDTERPISLDNAVFIAWGVANALDYAHRKLNEAGQSLEIVHRDVSPQNILISYQGEIKLADFGIAKAARRFSETQAGTLKGKFAYMSPEQAEGLDLDHRSDIFSLGVVLYEMATGIRLFHADSDISTLRKVLDAQVPLPSRVRPGFPFELEQGILSCLARDPRERFQNASDLRDHLIQHLISSGRHLDPSPLGRYVHELSTKPAPPRRERPEKLEKTQAEKPSPAASKEVSSSPPAPAPDRVPDTSSPPDTPPPPHPDASPSDSFSDEWPSDIAIERGIATAPTAPSSESSIEPESPSSPATPPLEAGSEPPTAPTPRVRAERPPGPPPTTRPISVKKPTAIHEERRKFPPPQKSERRSFPIGRFPAFLLGILVVTGLWVWRGGDDKKPSPPKIETQTPVKQVTIPPPPPRTSAPSPEAEGATPQPPGDPAATADSPDPGEELSAVSLSDLKKTLTAPPESGKIPAAPEKEPGKTAVSQTEPSPPGDEVETVKPPEPPSPVILPGEPGVLFMNILPWAVVYIDGEKKGRNTPIVGLEVSPGIHIIRVTNTELKVDYTTTLEIEPGEIARQIIDLTSE